MKIALRAVLFLLLGKMILPAQAGGDPALPGYFQLTQVELRRFQTSLQPKMNQYKQAADQLADFGNHTAWVAHREANGLAEIHQNWADLMFVISGGATLLVGGEIPDGKPDSPGEIRGSTIRSGQMRVIREGDVVQVPAGMPHQFLIGKGKQITFFTMKLAK